MLITFYCHLVWIDQGASFLSQRTFSLPQFLVCWQDLVSAAKTRQEPSILGIVVSSEPLSAAEGGQDRYSPHPHSPVEEGLSDIATTGSNSLAELATAWLARSINCLFPGFSSCQHSWVQKLLLPLCLMASFPSQSFATFTKPSTVTNKLGFVAVEASSHLPTLDLHLRTLHFLAIVIAVGVAASFEIIEATEADAV